MPEKESDDEHEGGKEAKKQNKKHFNKEEVFIEDLQLVAESFGGYVQDLHEIVPLVAAGALLKGADIALTVADVASNLKAGNVGGALRSAALGAIPVPGVKSGSKILKFTRAAKKLPKVKPHLPGKPPVKVPSKPAPKPPTRKPSPAPSPAPKPKAPPHKPAPKPAPKPSPFPSKPQRAPSIPAPAKPAPKPGTKPLPLPVKPTKPSPTPTQPKVEPKVQPKVEPKTKVGKSVKIATAAGLLGTSALVKPDFEPKTKGAVPPATKKPGTGGSRPGGGGGGGGIPLPKPKLGFPKTYVGDVGTARAKSG